MIVTLRSRPPTSATLRGPLRKRAHEHRDKRRSGKPAGIAEAATVTRALRLHSPGGPDLAIHRGWGGCKLGLPGLDVLPVHRPAGPGVTTPAMALPTPLGRRRLLLGRPAVTGNRPVRSVAVIARSCLGL